MVGEFVPRRWTATWALSTAHRSAGGRERLARKELAGSPSSDGHFLRIVAERVPPHPHTPAAASVDLPRAAGVVGLTGRKWVPSLAFQAPDLGALPGGIPEPISSVSGATILARSSGPIRVRVRCPIAFAARCCLSRCHVGSRRGWPRGPDTITGRHGVAGPPSDPSPLAGVRLCRRQEFRLARPSSAVYFLGVNTGAGIPYLNCPPSSPTEVPFRAYQFTI